MKLAFCLFKYFPFGGLQRDFYRIATLAADHGHEIHVYTMEWEGTSDPRFHIHLIPVAGMTNHGRVASYIKLVKPVLQENHYDAVIGFNKMPYLDFYYAADVCYVERIKAQRSSIYKLLPRYWLYKKLEEDVFNPQSKTKIMLISPFQQQAFMQYYHTPHERFHLLPPGISKDRLVNANTATLREGIRHQYRIPENHKLILMVGSGFKTKGVDRALLAFSTLSYRMQQQTYLYIIGHGNQAPFRKMAKELNIDDRVIFLGTRDDVPTWLVAADLLLHPSYHENTGTVLLEALASGLPVLTLDVCGYAHYVIEAQAGIVLPSPFSQASLNKTLSEMLLSPLHSAWRQQGIRFAKKANIYHMPEAAVSWIEQEMAT